MRQRKLLFTMAFMFYLALKVSGQEAPVGYNPFVSSNLDDLAKLTEIPVVESSYHRYSLIGDANYTSPSIFVWYVENGTLGIYDQGTDVWSPIAGAVPIGNGEFLELSGDVNNASDVWVRWNDGSGNTTGYIAVYERSSNDCIFDQQITGFKHQILVPPEIWFLVDAREECSDQLYSVTAQLNELQANSFPYNLKYTYPDINGTIVQADTTIYETDLDGSNQLHWDLEAVLDLNNTLDEVYVISLDEFRDIYGSKGKIAPLGEAGNQYPSITITILHLPQTGGMNMD